MSDFASIDFALLVNVTGGAVKGSGELTTTAGSVKGAVETSPDPVKVYGNDLAGCKQQASNNFGGMFQSSGRLDKQLALCEKNYGK